jgi:DNA-binding GntR family transcriptional regulator
MSLQTSSPVTPTLVADQVYEVLENAILTGSLGSGSPLRVRDLASMVGTSVMPVREAIRRLEEAGLATRIPHKGAAVRTFTVTELMHSTTSGPFSRCRRQPRAPPGSTVRTCGT